MAQFPINVFSSQLLSCQKHLLFHHLIHIHHSGVAQCFSSHRILPLPCWLQNNRNLFCHSSGGQKSENKVSVGPSSLECSKEDPSLPSGFWSLPESLAAASLHFCLQHHMAFFPLDLCVFPFVYPDFPLFIRVHLNIV